MNTCILSQEMAHEALKTPKSFVSEHLRIWRERRNMIHTGLAELGLDLWRPEGAFYVFPKAKNSKRMVLDLYKKHRVITYPGGWFGTEDRIRLSYALDIAKIEEGLQRIKKYLKRR